MYCENQKKPLVSVLLWRLCLQVCVSVTVRGHVPGCEPRGGVYSNDSVTHARSCVCVSARACALARVGPPPPPLPLPISIPLSSPGGLGSAVRIISIHY